MSSMYVIEQLRQVLSGPAPTGIMISAWVHVAKREAPYDTKALEDYLRDATDEHAQDGRYRVLRQTPYGFDGTEFTVARRQEFDLERIEPEAEDGACPECKMVHAPGLGRTCEEWREIRGSVGLTDAA